MVDIKFLIIIIALVEFFLAGLFYFRDRKQLTNIVFALVNLTSGLWALSLYFYEHPIFFSSFIWIKITYFFALFLTFFPFYFSLIFPVKKIKQISKLLGLYIFLMVPFLYFLFFTDLWIKGVVIHGREIQTVLGQLYILFIIYTGIFFSWTIINFVRNYLSLSGIDKERLRYILCGIFLSGLGIFIPDGIIPLTTGATRYFWLSPILNIFFVGFTAYAIISKKLFGIRIILTELSTGLIALTLLIQTITAPTIVLRIFNGSILAMFCFFGWLLVKSVLQEIKLREQLATVNKQLKKLDESKSEFISIASHQLRTPLAAIKGYISMILEGTYGKLNEQIQRPMKNVFQSNERLIKLVNDLLNLSRLDAGKIKFEPQPTSLEEMVISIIEELRVAIENKGLYIRMEKPKLPLPKVMIDQEYVRQVVLNIIDNATKYTKKGGITIELSIINDSEQIKISDTGEGMDQKEIASLFQIFSRSTAGTQLHAEGAGIGLYVARRFIEMHNGKIWVESEGKGKGSTFIIQIPINLNQKLSESKTKDILDK